MNLGRPSDDHDHESPYYQFRSRCTESHSLLVSHLELARSDFDDFKFSIYSFVTEPEVITEADLNRNLLDLFSSNQSLASSISALSGYLAVSVTTSPHFPTAERKRPALRKAIVSLLWREITEEKDEAGSCVTDLESQRDKIRKIIEYQKSLYWSSCSSASLSSSAASCSSFSSSRRSDNLFELMKGGSTSLRRLFDMEHTSLAKHFVDYSGSPVVKPILLWGSDTDEEIHDSWASIKQQIGYANDHGSDGQSRCGSHNSSRDEDFSFKNRSGRVSKRKLTRKKTFRRLPKFSSWRWRGLRIRFRLRRVRIMICGRKF